MHLINVTHYKNFQGWYIVTYALGIYHLNLFIAFLTPKIDPAMEYDRKSFPYFFLSSHTSTRGLNSVFQLQLMMGRNFQQERTRSSGHSFDVCLNLSFGIPSPKAHWSGLCAHSSSASTYQCSGPSWLCTF